jgi:hypothetical protein
MANTTEMYTPSLTDLVEPAGGNTPLAIGAELQPEDESDVYEVEDILDRRLAGRQEQYLIKWKGYEENTWEPTRNISPQLLEAFWRGHPKRGRGRPRKHPETLRVLQSKIPKRGKTGCLTCRKRKKKCDEVKPNCESHFLAISHISLLIEFNVVYYRY